MSYSDDWTDMSDYLVHFTKSGSSERKPYDNIISILSGQVLKAGSPFGAARVQGGQEAVCLSEVPLGLLGRLVDRRSPCGIGFTKEFITGLGGSPIWYVEKDGPQHLALKRLLTEARRGGEVAPLFKITPFIDVKGDYPSSSYRWEWEREWRVAGDFRFAVEDVAFLFLPEEHHDAAWAFFTQYVVDENLGPSYSCPFLDPTWDAERIRVELKKHAERPALLGQARSERARRPW